MAEGRNDSISATLEPGDQTTASAPSSRSSMNVRFTPLVGSTMTLRFDAARNLNSAPSSPSGMAAPDADHHRSASPSGGSSFMTSEPPSARIFVQ